LSGTLLGDAFRGGFKNLQEAGRGCYYGARSDCEENVLRVQ